MSGILGKKLGMTRLFQDDGRAVPITVVECEPNTITQVKTVDKDGYPAVVLGFSALKKPTKTRKFHHVREFKVSESDLGSYSKDANITLEAFKEVEMVKITATSKGKGYQGTIKRHNFARGPETHGSHHHREPGSVGTRAKPGRVHKGKKLPGQMGFDRVTISKVKVAYIDPEKNIIGLKGAVPGPNGGLVIISKV